MTFRCFLSSFILAWAVAVFVPSMFIAYAGLSPAAAAIGTGFDRLPATTWKVADDVGPAVKLMIGGLLLGGLLLLARTRIPGAGRFAAAILIGLLAVLVTMAVVPLAFSRGFAAGLTGARFETVTTILYLFGGALAGGVYEGALAQCRRRDAGQKSLR
ncbi:hypothetical protein ACNFJ7_17015 [Sphingomonas sp. HT-1]|uniref:hypothetical protein n=1 Tax=unclassified Sphingomonas TaxID=196159 RepID=UPI0002D99353|nr:MULTISPECIES: hypothetical protein [unclassified Sphingomonas]KTF70646.1 hypothetical protein ATB93_03870 [Sphingomonas sp. WG]